MRTSTGVQDAGRLVIGRPVPRYLDAGTWSTMIRGGREPPSGQLRMVEIQFGGGRPPAARLCRWDATAQVAASASAP